MDDGRLLRLTAERATAYRDSLADRAVRLGFEAVATGHHARSIAKGARRRKGEGACQRKEL